MSKPLTERSKLKNAATLMLTVLLATSFALSTSSQPIEDKKSYSLFHPVPRSEMREMSTDRPDATESPYTVDAGHVQLEVTLYGRTELKEPYSFLNNLVNETIGDLNLKFGLTDWMDIQTMITLREIQTVDGTHPYGSQYGTYHFRAGRNFREVTVRAKINLFGNDGGGFAAALMPFARVPISESSDDKAYGLILPFSFDLSPLSLGCMAQYWNAEVYDAYGPVREWNGLGSMVIGFPFTDQLGVYAEGILESSIPANSEVLVTVSTGLTYGLTDDLQLDMGMLQGITESTDDFGYFVGFSVRR